MLNKAEEIRKYLDPLLPDHKLFLSIPSSVSMLLFHLSYFSPKLISYKVMSLVIIFSFGLLYGVH